MFHLFKRLSFTGLALLGSFAAQARKGRAVPMAYDTKIWRMECSACISTLTVIGPIFGLKATRGERGDSACSTSLRICNQKHVHTASNAPLTGAALEANRSGATSFILYPSVTFAGRDLYQTASAVGNDFVWVPVSRASSHRLATYSWEESRQTVSRGVLAMLRAYLPTAISQLATPADGSRSDSVSSRGSGGANCLRGGTIGAC